ncbi:MAG: sugar ABC transporter permease [Clostridia bacterium]|nr:sugar ABC transporter permease [Clostridia bacterium]
MKKKRNSVDVLSMNGSKWRFLLFLVIPTFALYLFFCIVPMINSLINSFYDWNGYGPKTFIGIKNYANIFSDVEFWDALKNDVAIVFFKELIIVFLAVLFAVSLTRARLKKGEIGFFRFIFYVPNILSVIVITMVWKYFFENFDFLDKGWNILKTDNGIWADRPLALIIFIASWCGIGYYMIVLITAINNIPGELYESADLDGAGKIRQLWYIILPELAPQIRFVIVNILAGSLAVNMNLILPLTNGANHTMVMGLYVYNYGTSNLSMVGYAYAAALVLMFVSFVLCFAVNMYMKRQEAKQA